MVNDERTEDKGPEARKANWLQQNTAFVLGLGLAILIVLSIIDSRQSARIDKNTNRIERVTKRNGILDQARCYRDNVTTNSANVDGFVIWNVLSLSLGRAAETELSNEVNKEFVDAYRFAIENTTYTPAHNCKNGSVTTRPVQVPRDSTSFAELEERKVDVVKLLRQDKKDLLEARRELIKDIKAAGLRVAQVPQVVDR